MVAMMLCGVSKTTSKPLFMGLPEDDPIDTLAHRFYIAEGNKFIHKYLNLDLKNF